MAIMDIPLHSCMFNWNNNNNRDSSNVDFKRGGGANVLPIIIHPCFVSTFAFAEFYVAHSLLLERFVLSAEVLKLFRLLIQKKDLTFNKIKQHEYDDECMLWCTVHVIHIHHVLVLSLFTFTTAPYTCIHVIVFWLAKLGSFTKLDSIRIEKWICVDTAFNIHSRLNVFF